MTTALNEALTLTPDMGTILQDPDVRMPLIVLPVLPSNSWCKSGHPQVHVGDACPCCSADCSVHSGHVAGQLGIDHVTLSLLAQWLRRCAIA